MNIGIVGYGRLGQALERRALSRGDLSLAGVYSRRAAEGDRTRLGSKMQGYERLYDGEDIDILLIAGSSKDDLPTLTPRLARQYNVIDSFDIHGEVCEHYNRCDRAARDGKRLALVSVGWDPGLFSLMRALFGAVLPEGEVITAWGRGISQGHSNAIRHIDGVLDAVQYTVPDEAVIESFLRGEARDISATRLHRRECYVVAEEGKDRSKIEEEIRNMPDYFHGYAVDIRFVDADTLSGEHSRLKHGGRVIGREDGGTTLSFSLKTESNPDLTASIMLAYAHAVYQLRKQGEIGARTVMEIPLSALYGGAIPFHLL